MKKLFSIAFTVALVFCLSASVFAAPSQQDVVEVVSATDGNGNPVVVTLATTTKTITEAEATALIGKSAATVLSVLDVSVPQNTVFPVTVTFSIDGVTGTTVVYVLHWNGTTWDKIPATTANGLVTCTFNSLSPVAFVVERAVTSPRTSEGNVVVLVGILGAAALITAYGFSKRVHA